MIFEAAGEVHVSKSNCDKLKMKNIPTKKKKPVATKAMDDSISETISFVIKGHLTPLKTSILPKKTHLGKQQIRVTKDSSFKTIVSEKNKKSRDRTAVKNVNKEIKSSLKKQKNVTICKKVAAAPRGIPKKNMLGVLNSLVLSDVHRGDIGNSLLVNHAANKIKNEALKLAKPLSKESQIPLLKSATGHVKVPVAVKRSVPKFKPESIKREKQITRKKPKTCSKLLQPLPESKQIVESAVPHSPPKSKKPKITVADSTKPMRLNKVAASARTEKTPPATKISKIKKETVHRDKKPLIKKPKSNSIKPVKAKIKAESSDDTDEMPLDVLRQLNNPDAHAIKVESRIDSPKEPVGEEKPFPQIIQKAGDKNVKVQPGATLKRQSIKKRKIERKDDSKNRKLKLFGFWNGPKRHRVASLNAIAKVHCLYENETRGAIFDSDPTKFDTDDIKQEPKIETDESDKEEIPKRTLRSVPGLRGVGKHYDILEALTSSEENDTSDSPESDCKDNIVTIDKKPDIKKPVVKRRRKQCELMMDLKDMVVRKRMASLNASAILAASYSLERRAVKSPKSETTESDDSEESFKPNNSCAKKKSPDSNATNEDEHNIIEVQTTPSKKVAVILNQDTDVTITGVYVNSTTRSTHHEGFCSIAGMQYLISAKSHTQTASTTVAAEAIMQSTANLSSSDEATAESPVPPCKSYTPLGALSNMQPPGTPGSHAVPVGPPVVQHTNVLPVGTSQNIPHTSPIALRHTCQSAFSSPPVPYGPPPTAHHHPPVHPPPPPVVSSASGDQGYIHGYYQPAGPLITVPQHAHPPPPPPPQQLIKNPPLSEPSVSPTSPRPIQSQSSATDSIDSDVIITSVTNAKEAQQQPIQPPPPPPTYRYAPYPPTHPAYAYSYGPPQYYSASPHSGTAYHHDLCYSPTAYLHHKAYPPHSYRRHLTPPTSNQYYPPDVYRTPPPQTPTQQSQPAVTANPNSAYQPSQNGPPRQIVENYPPPPTLVEPYPSPHYYPGYGPPSCYSHSPASRPIPYLDAAYQSCPCPIEPCPKNGHTGPLTGDSKRSSHISSLVKESLPLPPVALALPLEPVSATGPPSPARGSAGMPPPPSPAGATYQPALPIPKHDEVECSERQPTERRMARVGKNMVRNNIAANFPENTMLLMCHAPQQQEFISSVKREIESPEQQRSSSDNISSKSNSESEDTTFSKISSSSESMVADPSSPLVEKENIASVSDAEEQVEPTLPKADLNDGVVVSEELLPCQKTVAENVKVKNMKRKLSEAKELEKVEAVSPAKIQKVENCKVNGSYKDLIKKNVTSIRINNGKRKLISDNTFGIKKSSSLKVKRMSLKHKLSMPKNETPIKRMKLSRPLTASNLHNSKQNCRSTKSKWCNSLELQKKSLVSTCKHKGNIINNNNYVSKKLAPAILDSLFAKNNVDRTIEFVVNGYSEAVRTIKKSEGVTNIIECGSKDVEVESKEQVVVSTKSTNPITEQVKTKPPVTKCVGAKKRKSRNSSTSSSSSSVVSKVPKKSLQFPRWSNGWTWKGESFQGKVFLNSDDNIAIRKCYPAMIHTEGDIIEPRDCVLLKAGPRKNDLPFVAKVASLWENPDDGEMMMSLLWYYRPEHTEHGRQPQDAVDEVFASRHKDTNSVACIEDKCYVLTFNEYCRYRKALKRLEAGLDDPGSCIPMSEPYPRLLRLPPAHMQTPFDLIFFCRKVYDFRQKRIIKNPS